MPVILRNQGQHGFHYFNESRTNQLSRHQRQARPAFVDVMSAGM